MQHAATFPCSFAEMCNTWQNIMVLIKTIEKRSVSISKIVRTFSKMSNIFRKHVTRFGQFRLFLVNSKESGHFAKFSENPDFFITRARNFWILLDFFDLIRNCIVFAHILLIWTNDQNEWKTRWSDFGSFEQFPFILPKNVRNERSCQKLIKMELAAPGRYTRLD